MSTFAFTFNEYLVDENGDYVLTDPLDPQSRIVIGTRSVTANGDYRPIGGGLRRKLNNRPVLSFEIKYYDVTGQWSLTVNRDTFIGIYPTQDAAVGVLYGLMTFHSGYDDSFATFLGESVNTRGSTIDSADVTVDYVYGRTSILADLVDSKAHIMVIGDSISNDSAAGFATWPQGMAAHWRPVAWESAFISSGTGGGTVIGTKLITSTGASASATDYSQDVKPGAITTAVTNSGLAGHHPRIGAMQLIKDNWNEGQTYRPTLIPSVLYYDGDTIPATIGKKLYQNLDGSYNFYTGANVTANCFVTSRGDGVLAPNGEGYIPGITLRWYYDGSYDFVAGDTTVDFTAGTPPTGLYTWGVETQQLSLPDWNVGDVQVFFKGPTGTGWPAGGGWHGTSGGFLNKAGVTNGMRFAYIGQGGWETKNHALEYGDPNIPLVEGTYYGSYTDAGLEDFIRVTD